MALQEVWDALRSSGNLTELFTDAVHEAVQYVLDGARTWRFDLLQPEVDSDERASVGTKLQYRLIEKLGLDKRPPLDVLLAGHPVDFKGTVRDNWPIPTEAFCQLCICVKIDARAGMHRAWLFRTHRQWLHSGEGNGDKKRGIQQDAMNRYAVALYETAPFPQSPLKMLDEKQLAAVFHPGEGQEKRLLCLFRYLPGVVFPREAILTVCAQREDPMRRARAIKERAAEEGVEVLVGTWTRDRARADELGFILPKGAWIAVPRERTLDLT